MSYENKPVLLEYQVPRKRYIRDIALLLAFLVSDAILVIPFRATSFVTLLSLVLTAFWIWLLYMDMTHIAKSICLTNEGLEVLTIAGRRITASWQSIKSLDKPWGQPFLYIEGQPFLILNLIPEDITQKLVQILRETSNARISI